MSERQDDIDHTRRGVLRCMGVAGGASAGVGAATVAASEPASAGLVEGVTDFDYRDHVKENAGIGWTYHPDHPDLPGYEYVGSIDGDDLCAWTSAVCVAGGGIVGVLKKAPYFTLVSGLLCEGGAKVGCTIRERVQSVLKYDANWLYVYRATQNVTQPAEFLMIPRMK